MMPEIWLRVTFITPALGTSLMAHRLRYCAEVGPGSTPGQENIFLVRKIHVVTRVRTLQLKDSVYHN